MKAFAPLAVFVWALANGCTPDRPGHPLPDAAVFSAPTAIPPEAASSIPALTAEQEKAAQSILVNDCLACHAEEMLAQQRLSPEQWAAVVKKMQRWGSLVEPSHVQPLVAFLSAHYGLTAPRYVPKAMNAVEAEAALARLPDGPFGGGDTKKGEASYKETCAPCHGAGARGSSTGVALADRPGLWRAAQFASVVREGRGRMPAFPAYTDAEIAALVAYLRWIAPG